MAGLRSILLQCIQRHLVLRPRWQYTGSEARVYKHVEKYPVSLACRETVGTLAVLAVIRSFAVPELSADMNIVS
jgi:hypothetical protein